MAIGRSGSRGASSARWRARSSTASRRSRRGEAAHSVRPRDGYERFVVVGRDKLVAIEEELRARLDDLDAITRSAKTGLTLMPAAVPSLVELLASRAQLDAAPAFWSLLARIDAARTSEPKVPRAFAKVLRPYQIEGFRWMSRLAAWGAGACLVDEMGLGKTVQALALLISRSKAGPALVVAPTSVGPNWIHEARRFAPSLKATLHRGAGRPSSLANVGPDDVIVTSYDVLARDADAGFFGAEADFRGRYVVPIERDKDASRSAALARVVRPFLLRCKKAEVATELPSRTELTRAVERSPAERKLYEAAREDLDESARLRGGDGQAR